jgi:hypothetical protein
MKGSRWNSALRRLRHSAPHPSDFSAGVAARFDRCPVFVDRHSVFRIESVKHFPDRGPRLACARRKPSNDRQEAVAGQRLQFQVAGSPNRGGTRHSAQQRNLSKPIAWTQLGDNATVSDDIGSAGLDHMEAVSGSPWRKTGWPADTWIGSKPRANCLMAGSGNGWNMGTL